ncbi:hypothetical protein Hypma_004535 [Hypsizygus marmoreus]|uniref:Rab-GAP TBC domain-containing protein n=1 Tax=Hypsizygus marmoreus TaxID=39966 RepID=A0A369JZS6_HYPMA|nr:hypothetical protein Hypma_004535 [Hypsizygus marmoreus]
MAMEAAELARWTRFAAKGGIGKCTAISDCVAENADDLMFLKDDEITVLMQLPEPSGLFLGYCEGVVGRFHGFNVHFHSKLKKPIMAKRSSVSASGSGQGKSPTPPHGLTTPSPLSHIDSTPPSSRRVRVSLDEHVSASIKSIVSSPASSPDPMPPPVVGTLRLGKPRSSFGTSDREMSDGSDVPDSRRARASVDEQVAASIKQTLVLPTSFQDATYVVTSRSGGSRSNFGTTEKDASDSGVVASALSPPKTHTTSASTSTTSTLVDSTPTNTVPPPNPIRFSTALSSRHTSVLSSYSQESNADPQPLHESNPIPELEPIEDHPPLSITSSPGPPTASTLPTSALDTTISTDFDNSRISLALSDGEVGIGLSLLQNLADGEYDDWSDSGSDSPVVGRKNSTRSGRGSIRRRGSRRRRGVQVPARSSFRMSINSDQRRYDEDDGSGSDERLGYEDTETGHGSLEHGGEDDTLEAHITQTQAEFSTILSSSPLPQVQQQLTFPPIAPLSPSRSRFRPTMPAPASGFEFPTPPTHTYRASVPPQPQRLPHPSPKLPLSDLHPDAHEDSSQVYERERLPSLAPSIASTSNTTSDWEGASDIYDDYRYSRFSMSAASIGSGSISKASGKRMSGASRRSVASSTRMSGSSRGGAGGGAGFIPPFVDDPEARSRADSMPSRPSVDQQRPSVEAHANLPTTRSGLTRTRSNTNASLNPVVVLDAGPSIAAVPLPSASRASASTHSVQTIEVTQLQDLQVDRRASSHRKMESLGGSESDASVYTQSSTGKGSVISSRALDAANPSNSASPMPHVPTSRPPSTSNFPATHNRPAPLHLVNDTQSSEQVNKRSPLLHTTWGTPVSSPAPHDTTTKFGDKYTPTPSGYTGTSEGFTGFGMGLEALGRVLVKEDSSTGGGGIASAIRQRLEVDRKPVPPSPSATDTSLQEEGVGRGRRIVVEDDEDEIILPRSQPSSAPVSPAAGAGKTQRPHSSASSSSPEPEPEIVAQGRLGPLVIANRTPSPSDVDTMNDSVSALMEPPSPMVPSMPVINLPQTTSTPPPPPYSSPAYTPAPTNTPPPSISPSLTTSPPSHLRPSLLELRGLPPGQPDQGQRQSLFLPHPNAPKPPSALSPGPMYIAQQQPPPPPPQVRGGVMQTIRMALAGQGGGVPSRRGPTIYGITATDLASAAGPVLMMFSVDPPPATAPSPGSMPSTQGVPVIAPIPIHAGSSSLREGLEMRRVTSTSSLNAAAGVTERSASADQRASPSGVIPRANFFPKAGAVRPRSRSFSGFQSTSVEVPLPIQRSREDGIEVPSASDIKRSLSPITASPTSPTSKMSSKLPPLRVSSPLSRSENGVNGSGIRLPKPPNSPLAQSTTSGFDHQVGSVPSSPTASTSTRPVQQLRQMASRSTLNESPTPKVVPLPRRMGSDASNSVSPPTHFPHPQASGGRDSASPAPNRSRPSVDTDAVSVHSSRSNVVSPPPTTIGRHNSLRTKLSLPNLRRNLTRQDDATNVSESPVVDGDMMQVQDMDFELVRPNIAQFQAARPSEDSDVLGRDGSFDLRHDSNFLRAESPAISMPRSPTVVSESSTSTSNVWQPMKSSNAQSKALGSESSMDAHRQRELKWMSVLSSVPPSQSRKNKKVKKLLFDGVPSSVRYLVWSHLTDGKARCVPGVYSQLGARVRVAAFVDIERDIRSCFTDYPQLQSSEGPVISLLQAYLTMVPDIQYMTGLTLIAGQLLLLAPEEDAFWIFVSIMDTHLRSYFASTTAQIDVDASLFSRALETIDPMLAKKVFVDMAITPTKVCRPWFTSLFVGTLPADYLNRVWDVFLFEGVPFLLRIGLALASCNRRRILESTSEQAALHAFLHSSPSTLPPTPDGLISLAFAIKLKDDDIRKQRIKMEAQVKRQTQAPRLVSTPGSISLPRA